MAASVVTGLILLSLALLLLLHVGVTTAQQCDGTCAAQGLCCNDGHCVSGEQCYYGCEEGPCITGEPTGVKVADVVTDDFFNGILISKAVLSCPGKAFYTRSAFLEAAAAYPSFGTRGPSSTSGDDSKREIAAFFAHVVHESNHLCDKEEKIKKSTNEFCDVQTVETCEGKISYHGRGPLKLRWPENYGPAMRSVGLDGLTNPEKMIEDPVISFKTALWYWMNKKCHVKMIYRRGFGTTIKAIDSAQCNDYGSMPKVKYYVEFCKMFKVDPGTNLDC